MVEEKKSFSVLLGIHFLLVLFIINRLLFYSPDRAESTYSYITYPFLWLHYTISAPFVRLYEYSVLMQHSKTQIDQLREQNETLKAELCTYKALDIFEKQTKELVEYAERYKDHKKQLAQVLYMSISEQEDCMWIDVGSKKDIYNNAIVVYKNMLVGRVIESYPWYSKVALLTDTRCRISAQTALDSEGIFIGLNNGRARLDFIPHFKHVAVDDLVFSTGHGMVYPKGFALGRIEHISTDNSAHSIMIAPLLSWRALSYVYVISQNDSSF